MSLQIMETEEGSRLTLQENGTTTVYGVSFDVCANPACACNTVDMILTPVADDHKTGQRIPARLVPIDLKGKKVADKGDVAKRGPERDFAKSVVKQMDDDDFRSLALYYLAVKQRRTETARPEDVDAWFEYEEIEEKGLLTAYRDILPYADPLLVTLSNERCVVLDLYCLRSSCLCTETVLSVYPAVRDGITTGKELGSYLVDYRKKTWQLADAAGAGKGWLDPQTARQAMEEQNPSIYEQMGKRHVRLAEIYRHCRRSQGMIEHKPAQSVKVGRNDPCPCGSGKKYKKCCLGK
ncbi:MAG: SEC-C metal-binding domain-containing protein [Thermodesulfobacteriota bacterium]